MTPSPVNNLPTSAATESICARRGNQWLTKDDLEAHLAAVVRLENVGILLGAGASAEALGGVTMADLWTDFTKCYQASAAWLRYEASFRREKMSMWKKSPTPWKLPGLNGSE